jgi:hypothetical protein
MGILIGMDEAGYGPNLGPLVVAATVWDVAGQEVGGRRSEVGEGSGFGVQSSDDRVLATQSAIGNPKSAIDAVDLYRLLRGIVAKSPSERRIAIADSKKLHQPRKGLRRLEHGLHTVLAAMGQAASCWSALVESCMADPDEHHAHLCWHTGFDCRLPVDVPPEDVARLAARFRKHCDLAGVRPIAIRARFVFPAQFNELSEQLGGKGAALSHVTIGLLREVMDALHAENAPSAAADSPSLASDPRPPTSTFAVCDKHSSRNFYAGLLQNFFPDDWILPVCEGDAESRYEWGPAESRVCVTFRAKGESFLPTALASMTAKYLRELSMRAFNEFWCAQVPGLLPTAGYPRDSHRFRDAISAKQRELMIDDHIIWRRK